MLFHVVSFVFNLIVLSGSPNPFEDLKIDYAASTEAMRSLAKHELKIVKLLTNYAQLNYTNQLLITSYLLDFQSSSLAGLEWRNESIRIENESIFDVNSLAVETSQHPAISLRCIRRIVKLLPEIIQEIPEHSLKDKLNGLKEELPYPDSDDLETAMRALLRLKQTYQVNIDHLVDGNFLDVKTGSGLNARICYEIGLFAQQNSYHSQAIDFLDKALRMAPNEHFLFTPDEITDMRSRISELIAEHDSRLTAGIGEEDFHQDSMPFFFETVLHGRFNESFLSRKPFKLEIKPDQENSRIDIANKFEKLCRGENLKKLEQKSSLRCYLDWSKHPFRLIAPVKIEVHHEDPVVLQIYDVLTEFEMKQIKLEVSSEMRRSQTVAQSTEQRAVSSRFRTSSNSWIHDRGHETFSIINKRVSSITGFDLREYTSTEHVQIANYAPGGHYWAHTDAVHEKPLLSTLPPIEFLSGDRLATFMIYLSEVEAGGYTVFPILKIGVIPVPGSAVFWFNLHSDGSIHRKMLHAGCPVLYGNKWVANKWMRLYDQMFVKRCPLTFKDKINFLF